MPDFAFSYCISLTGLSLPHSLKNIGISAFGDCNMLTEVILHDGLERIENYAFEKCTSLREIVLPKGIKFVGKRVFSGCKNITVYCEEYSKPEGWDNNWNVTGGLFIKKRCRVVWGWKN